MQQSASRPLSAHAIAGGGVGHLVARYSTFHELHREREEVVREQVGDDLNHQNGGLRPLISARTSTCAHVQRWLHDGSWRVARAGEA